MRNTVHLIIAAAYSSPDGDMLYAGRLAELIEQPAGGRPLEAGTSVEGLNFTLALSEAGATNMLQNVALLTDFIFVDTQSPA